MAWYKTIFSSPYFSDRTIVTCGVSKQEAIDDAFVLWSNSLGISRGGFGSIPMIQSSVELTEDTRIFRMVYKLPTETKERSIVVSGLNLEDARDECMAEIYKIIGPGWTNMTSGIKMIPAEVYLEEL